MVYWNTANLIVDSGSLETGGNTDYGRIATAIGLMWREKVYVTQPHINTADISFKPDAKDNKIIFGLQGIKGINGEMAMEIINKRPYASFKDFLEKHKEGSLITTSKIVQLIKAGCFNEFNNEYAIMKQYLNTLYEPVNKLGLAQLNRIHEIGLLSEGHDMYLNYRMIGFKKYVLNEKNCVKHIVNPDRKIPKSGYHDRGFVLDEASQIFFEEYFTEESVIDVQGNKFIISEKKFTKELEQKYTKPLTEWMNQQETIDAYNDRMFELLWEKHAEGVVEHWHMEALSYYPVKHELSNINSEQYGIVDFFEQEEEAKVYDVYYRWVRIDDNKSEQKPFNKYLINRIWGTVVDSNNDKHFVTLMTPTGIVNVKFNRGQYQFYNRTISEIDDKGSKYTIENSWFKRGSLLMIAGYRNGDHWRAHTYADSIYKHTVTRILSVTKNGQLALQNERYNSCEVE